MDQKHLMQRPAVSDPCLTDVPRIRGGDLHLLEPADVAGLVRAGSALGDPIRVQMIHLLGQRSDLCTCELEELLGLAQSKVSYHLRILLDAGIVALERHGTWSHYSLRQRGVLERLKALTA